MTKTPNSMTQEEYALSVVYWEERARATRHVAISLGIAGVAFITGSLAMDHFLAESTNPALPTLVSISVAAGVLSLLGAAVSSLMTMRYSDIAA